MADGIDIALGIFVALYALSGWRRGFFASAVSLLGIVIIVWITYTYYRPLAEYLRAQQPMPRELSWLVAAAGLVLGTSLLWSLVTSVLLAGPRSVVRELEPLRVVDSLAGFALGAAVGVVMAATLATLAMLAPLPPPVRNAVDTSRFGRPLVDSFAKFTPAFEPLLSQAIEDALPFLPRAETTPRQDLNFPKDLTLEVDTASERRMFDLVNQERAKNGLPAVRWDEQLAEAARAHALEMFRSSYFAHDSPVTGAPANRARQAGVRFRLLGENLAFAPTAEIAHAGLLNSPGHRANILTPEFGRLGVGVVRGGVFGRMFAEEFAD